MKRLLSVITVAAFVACNSNPKTAGETTTVPAQDTAGLAAYQQWKAQNELAQQNTATAAPVTRSTTTSRNTSSTRSSSSGSVSSTSSNTAKAEDKGWSKKAKGAVIGGVVGAGAGAVINKKNRGAGAVIGGAVGAGVGYGIGRHKDKKDGRQ